MTGYDVVLFDLDGTLTDSKIGITKSVQYAFRSYALEQAIGYNIDYEPTQMH